MKSHLQAFAFALLAASSAIGGALANPSDPGIDLASIRERAADQTCTNVMPSSAHVDSVTPAGRAGCSSRRRAMSSASLAQ